MGEARLHFGFARPVGCLVTIGTGMTPNVALPAQGTNPISAATSTIMTLEKMWELATKTEHANKLAQPLCEAGTYYRFNVGEKIPEKRWVEKVEPSLFGQWFGGETPQEIEHFTVENWKKITIDLADYKHMEEFAQLTQRYMQTQEEIKRSGECATKLPPKRPAPQAAKSS